jgi:hypothetical protein
VKFCLFLKSGRASDTPINSSLFPYDPERLSKIFRLKGFLLACPGRSVRAIQHVFFRLTFTVLFFSADRI